jgi:amidase
VASDQIDDPAFWDIYRTGEKLRNREITAVELTENLLNRIKETDSRYRAFTTVTAKYALEKAEIAHREISQGAWKGPLHGVPIGIKDIVDTSFAPTTAGSGLFVDFVPKTSATVVDRLEKAGAIIVGKVKTTEGAWTGYAEKDAPPLNALSEDYWCGASSSGSGVAVSAGLCAAALASDTGGSIRVPSWVNGVTGLKTSWGAVSRAGVFALAPSLDTIGTIARNARDCGVVFDAIAGSDPADPTSWDIGARPSFDGGGVRIGVDPDFCFDGVDDQIVAAITQAIRTLELLGGKWKNVKFPDQPANHEAWNSIVRAEVTEVHREHFPARASEYGPVFRSLLEESAKVTLSDVIEAIQHRDALRRSLELFFQSIDVFITPVAPMLVPSPDGWVAQDNRSERFLGVVNLAGLPSLTLPVGVDNRGMPLSMQIVGRYGSDSLLVAVGQLFQSVTSFHNRSAAY